MRKYESIFFAKTVVVDVIKPLQYSINLTLLVLKAADINFAENQKRKGMKGHLAIIDFFNTVTLKLRRIHTSEHFMLDISYRRFLLSSKTILGQVRNNK